MKTIQELSELYPHLMNGKELVCPKGWLPLVTDILNHLNSISWYDKSRETSVTYLQFVSVLQIKEKFGQLRFYVRIIDSPCGYDGACMTKHVTSYVRGVVDFACRQSLKICQECGDTAATQYTIKGWISTLCEHHYYAKIMEE